SGTMQGSATEGGMHDDTPPRAPWRVLSTVTMRLNERVCCVAEVPLHDGEHAWQPPSTTSGVGGARASVSSHMNAVVCVGTCTMGARGEDAMAQGRLLMYRVRAAHASAHVAAQADVAWERVYEEELPCPATEVQSLTVRNASGALLRHIVVSTGREVRVYQYERERGAHASEPFRCIGKSPLPVWCTSVATSGPTLLLTDVYHSWRLLRWTEQGRERGAFPLVHDSVPMQTQAACVWDNAPLEAPASSILVADKWGNVHALTVNARDMDVDAALASRPVKLSPHTRTCDAHLGAVVCKLHRLRAAHPPFLALAACAKQVALFGTYDGSVGCLSQVDEATTSRLLALQKLLVYTVPQACGLHPKAWRTPRQPTACAHEPSGRLLDGNVLWQFMALDAHSQRQVAAQIGTTPERVLALLRALSLSACVF
ncbi:hypothetical protein EON67_03620, partial [archaeon]